MVFCYVAVEHARRFFILVCVKELFQAPMLF